MEPICLQVASFIRPRLFTLSKHHGIRGQCLFRGISRYKSTFSKAPLEVDQSVSVSLQEPRVVDDSSFPPNPTLIKPSSSTIPIGKIMRKVYKSDKALFGELLETKRQKTARVKKETKQKLKSAAYPPEFLANQPSCTENVGDSKVLFQPNNRKTRPPKSLPFSDKKLSVFDEEKKSSSLICGSSSSSISKLSSQNAAEANWAAKMSPRMIKVIEAPPINEKSECTVITERAKVTEAVQPEPLTVKHLFLPSVSKILNLTMPQEQAEALEKWQAKMIAQLGVEGFRLYKENMLNNGRMLHGNIEKYLRGTSLNEIEVAEGNAGHWRSLQHVLPLVQNARVIEERVVHPELHYCGIVDCVAVYKDKLVLIDWKTSQKQKWNISMTYDTPVQIAAYIGAINSDPNFPLKIDEGLIVIAYEDGSRSHTYLLKPVDVAMYWQKWTDRVKLYYEMNPPKRSGC